MVLVIGFDANSSAARFAAANYPDLAYIQRGFYHYDPDARNRKGVYIHIDELRSKLYFFIEAQGFTPNARRVNEVLWSLKRQFYRS